MRPFAILCLTALSLATLLPLAGCESGGKRFLFGPSPSSDPRPTPTPGVLTAESLVDYLNENASRMTSLRCTDIDITATQKLQSIGLRAKMMAMKPRSFLMTATAFGSPVLDLGSNNDEFWFWFSKSPDPFQFYCSYKDFEDGKVARFPFPFQPDWIMEALGMGPYGPASRYTVEQDGGTLKLVEKTKTPQGQPVRKVIVFNRREVKAPTPQVQAYLLLDDATGKEICSAQIHSVKVHQGAVVPHRFELRVPAEGAKLSVTFGDMTVNPQLDAAAFQRQPLKGVQSFDLARGPIGGSGRSAAP